MAVEIGLREAVSQAKSAAWKQENAKALQSSRDGLKIMDCLWKNAGSFDV